MNGRFAPSPTGVLHLGNLRTALLAWLFARSAGSSFVVRIEDLDAGRVRPERAAEQLADLAAIGLDWDGEVLVQSARGAVYAEALSRLPVYECFCTRAEIRESVSAAHGPVGLYPGTCLGLTDAEREARRAAGRVPALRVHAGGVRVDLLRSGARAADAAWSTTSSCVATTALTPTTSRSSSTTRRRGSRRSSAAPTWPIPRRARSGSPGALGVPAPAYAHVPLVLGEDGRRLAKRHGSVTLREVPVDARWRGWARRWGCAGRTAAEMLDGFEPPCRASRRSNAASRTSCSSATVRTLA